MPRVIVTNTTIVITRRVTGTSFDCEADSVARTLPCADIGAAPATAAYAAFDGSCGSSQRNTS